MKIHLALLIYIAHVALGLRPKERSATFCGDPAQDDYTLVQGVRLPFGRKAHHQLMRFPDPFFGDQDFGQPGIILETVYGDASLRWFMIYQNSIDFKPYRAMNASCSA
jgi:hypothetical protein